MMTQYDDARRSKMTQYDSRRRRQHYFEVRSSNSNKQIGPSSSIYISCWLVVKLQRLSRLVCCLVLFRYNHQNLLRDFGHRFSSIDTQTISVSALVVVVVVACFWAVIIIVVSIRYRNNVWPLEAQSSRAMRKNYRLSANNSIRSGSSRGLLYILLLLLLHNNLLSIYLAVNL